MRRTGSNVFRALAVSLLLAPAAALAAVGDCYVTSDASNMVRMYDGTTGAYLNVFTPSTMGAGELGIHFSTAYDRVLVGHFGGGVDEYVASTGAYIKTYIPGSSATNWVGVYGPTGQVYIGSWSTMDVRRYDSTTGALLGFLCPIYGPSDMKFGPNGNLYICSYYGGFVLEVDPVTGGPINTIPQPPGSRSNDVAFNPANGEMLVTDMGQNVVFRYDNAYNFVGQFAGTGWMRPHGIEIHPVTGNVMAVDGVTGQVHEFDPVTYAELNPAWLVPAPGDKIVDLAFRPALGATPAEPLSWGRIKRLYR